MEVTKEYLKSIDYNELLKLYIKYNSLRYSTSKYDSTMSEYFASIEAAILVEIERRDKLNNSDKIIIDSNKKKIKK